MKLSGTWKGVFVLLVAGACAFALYHWKFRSTPQSIAQYRTAEILRGDIQQLVTASGQVEPVINVLVGSQISGTIDRIYVDYNSFVTNGQILAQIDPASYHTALKQTEGELANALASLELARINARRAGQLHQDRLISEADHDKAQADLRQAEAIVRIREAMVDKAQVDLTRTTIYSPIDGVIISRDVEVGQTVAASFNTPKLFMIANDLTRMHIHANVSEADIGGVDDGQPVEFTVDAFPTRRFTGIVEQVRNAPTTNQNVITYTTVIAVSNPDLKLKPGMTANVAITLAHASDVLKIPNAAFRFRPPDTSNGSAPSPTRAQAPNSDRAVMAGAPGSAGSVQRFQMSGSPTGMSGRQQAGAIRPFSGNTAESGEDRTVYLLTASADGNDAAPPGIRGTKVRVGISDGAFTEIRDGLQEGDKVVIGALNNTVAAPAARDNPFAPPRPPRR